MDMKQEPLRIIELQAENVKRLKAVRIKPNRTMVRLEGKNAQGKTSVLDAIAAALGGGKQAMDKPVNADKTKASVTLDLGELIVTRRWTPSGSVLEVTSEGHKLGTPQAILDKLVGDLTFDPLGFVQMDARKQADVLRRVVGLNFDEHDAKRKELFEKRTSVNRLAKESKARLAMVPKPATSDPIDVAKLASEYAENERIRDTRNSAKRCLDEQTAKVEELERSLTNAREALTRFQQMFDDAPQPIDTDDLAVKIKEAQTINDSIDAYKAFSARSAECDALEQESQALSDELAQMDARKSDALLGASFPVDGLSIDDDYVTLHGIPFSQASSAEQLRVSVAIGLAQNPRCRVMLCRDGSLLDEASMKALETIATEHDAQVFIERVAEGPSGCGVYIEDGEVVV